jgi:hypothetical protein
VRLRETTDPGDRALAKDVLEERYAWQEAGVLDLSGDLPWIAEHEADPSTIDDAHRTIA